WTIHGLWINYCNGSWYCPMDTPLPTNNITKLLLDNNKTDLVKDMMHYWNPDEDYNNLWLHELKKHASCMSTIQPSCYDDDAVRGWIDYFESTVQLYLKYPIFDVLKAHGILPGYYYSTDSIKDALFSTWNITLSLQCEENILSEVFLYFHAIVSNFIN
ncbi:ribonuclease T2, partial [Backusella circina FSU 941]